jgi:hypothetical protein
MKTKQTKIIEAIRVVCTETMELKFGCKLLRISNDCPEYIIAEKPSEDSVELRCWDGWQKKQWVRDNFEILGTELDLSHLLRAIEGKKSATIETDGFISVYGGVYKEDEVCQYNLTKTLAENLEDPVLCEFLFKLLCEHE